MSRDTTRRATITLLALATLGAGAATGVFAGCSSGPVATTTAGNTSGTTPTGPNVGDPCVPPDELDPAFGGFNVQQEYIVEGDNFSCTTGICLVNHFQGRVTCPLGQAAPTPCKGPADTATCGAGVCVSAARATDACDPGAASPCGATGRTCDPAEKVCKCSADAQCGAGAICDPTGHCLAFVCSAGAGICQAQGASSAQNQGKACCVPGTTTPVTAEVCGECAASTRRDADETVYCSCRCAPADGAPPEPDAKFCACPSGFSCTPIRAYLGVGDPSLAGSYCIKEGSAYTGPNQCTVVHGNADQSMCAGVAAP